MPIAINSGDGAVPVFTLSDPRKFLFDTQVQNCCSYRSLSKWFAGLEGNKGKYVRKVIRTL